MELATAGLAGLNVRVLPFSIWFFVQPVRAALLKIVSHLADVKELEVPPQLIVSALAWLAAMADDVRHAKVVIVSRVFSMIGSLIGFLDCPLD